MFFKKIASNVYLVTGVQPKIRHLVLKSIFDIN